MRVVLLRVLRIAVLVVALLVPVGARSASAATPPEQVHAAVAELDALATQLMEETGVPGLAVAVVYRDEVVYLKGFGVRRVGSAAPVTPDTVFQIASVSKPIAATVVAALVGDGVVNWDDRIVDLDPDFQLFDPLATDQVTIRDLFSHRSGLPDHAGDLVEDLGYDREEVLYRLRFFEPEHSFRAGYAYTNFGLTEAAVAAAEQTGRSWEDVAVERLYRPLGMTSTSSRHADYLAAPNRASLHVLENGRWVAKYDRQPDAQSPAGGVSSSVRDLAQWLRLQLGNGLVDGRQIVAPAALDETHRPQSIMTAPANPSIDRASFYGIGWNVHYDDHGRVRLSHSGAFSLGAGTSVVLYPAEQIGIVTLSNAAPVGVPETVNTIFMDLALNGEVTRDWVTLYREGFRALSLPPYPTVDESSPPAAPAPALPLDAYAGDYENALYGPGRVRVQGDGLVLELGPRPMVFPLRHRDGDVFVYDPPGENGGFPAAVTFTIGADGRADSVTIDNLNTTGQGVFSRAAPSD